MTRPDRRLDRLADRLDTAARLKPAVDAHLAQMLGECDTRQTNETGITGNTLPDPVMSAVLSRAHWIDRSNAVDAAVQAIEAAVNQLDEAMRRVDVPRALEAVPICRRCKQRHVEHYRRGDGSIGYRTEGLCASCRSAVRRGADDGDAA